MDAPQHDGKAVEAQLLILDGDIRSCQRPPDTRDGLRVVRLARPVREHHAQRATTAAQVTRLNWVQQSRAARYVHQVARKQRTGPEAIEVAPTPKDLGAEALRLGNVALGVVQLRKARARPVLVFQIDGRLTTKGARLA